MRNAFTGEFQDYYTLLGLTSMAASNKEIRAAYRRLARIYHPDLNHGDQDDMATYAEANAQMCRLNEAYYVLGDSERRAVYDRQRLAWLHPASARPASARPASARPASARPAPSNTYPGFKPRYTPYDLDVPDWIERFYGFRLNLTARLEPLLFWIDLLTPILTLVILFLLGFFVSERIAADPFIHGLGIGQSDVLLLLVVFAIFWFVPFWFLLKFKR